MWITHTGYHLQVLLNVNTDHTLEIDSTIDQPYATVMKKGTDEVGLDLSPIIIDTTAKVTMIPKQAIPGHTTGTTDDVIGVVHDAHIQVLIHIILTMTLHTTDHLHIGALQLTPETTADHTLNQPYKPAKKTSHQSSSQSRRPQCRAHTKRNLRVTIDDPQMDFYSSDDNSSDSEEDSDHLN